MGGVERQAHSIAVALLDAGHEVHFFCQRADANIDGRIVVHRVSNPLRPLRWFKVWWFDRASERAVGAAGPFDLVQGFGKTSRQDVYFDGSGCLADFQRWSVDAALPSAWRRSLRRASVHQRVVGAIERNRYTPGNYRHILAISDLVRDQILRRYGLPESDVETLYPGVDLERFRNDPERAAEARRSLGISRETPLLGFLGSDYRRKGLPVFLETLARLPEAHGFVIGNERSERVRAFRETAARLGAGDRVHWLGVQPEPEGWLTAADAFLFPTHFDAFGSAALEALACGVPAFVSETAGAAELVTPGVTGERLAPGATAEAWASAVGPWLAPRDRGAVRGRAREAAEAHPWTRHIDRVLELYRELSDVPRRG